MDKKIIMKITKACAGAMTADVAVLVLKSVLGNTLGGVLETGIREFLEKYQDMSEEELKKTPVPEHISEEVKKQIELYLKEQEHPVDIGGVDFYFAEDVSVEDTKTLKRVLQHVNPDQEEKTRLNADVVKYQKVLDDLIYDYVNEYINSEIDEDYGIKENNLYINFDDNNDDEWTYNQKVEEDICQMKEALNHLLAAFGSTNKIVRHLFY